MKTKKKKRLLIVIAFLVIFLVMIGLGLGLYLKFGSSHGIPWDVYYPCDESGNIVQEARENHERWIWQINYFHGAEYAYIRYDIIEEGGKLYFEYTPKSDIQPSFRYEVEYDKSTKILTVYMPSDLVNHLDNTGDEGIMAFRYKAKA